ncbi:MAG: glycosyl transferase [Chloroflexota bacterium]|nr:MAG: glycosyl transferase [Chloroflexota bacterium]
MFQNPLISIIVSTKNEEKNLERLLVSIRQQTYPHYEIIVVDNFSTDATVKIARKFTNKVYLKGPERSAQRNFAVTRAQGDYLLILDADMELAPRALSNYIKECQNGDYSALTIPEINPAPNFWAQCRNLEKQMAHGEWHLNAARFIKKDIFLAIKGYDESLVAAEDYDLDDRLRKANAKIGTGQPALKHYESQNIIEISKKKYYYGKMLRKYVVKNKLKALRRFTPFRPVYLKKVRLLIANPVYALGLCFLKMVDYCCGTVGITVSVLHKKGCHP